MSSKFIQSASNPEIKHLAKLIRQRSYRQSHQQIVVEGIHLLQTFIDADMPIFKVYVPETCYTEAEIQILLSRITPDKIVFVAEGVLHKVSSLSNAEEITAIFYLPATNMEISGKDVVILEDVQDPGNVGTILRSSIATGITDIVLSKHCADVWSPKVLRSAMGAHAFLKFHEAEDIALWCRQYPYLIYATVLSASAQSLYALDLTQPSAWIFGNEGAGIRQDTLAAIRHHVIIPMTGPAESLNVAMAASVCLFEQQRQRLNSP
ncbi:RNA methyltransferase [Neisseriaceae bacterium ESL0693]|nr:RNA methyltransferase [Neisseriaceae bacterium ESL0693]